MKTVSLVGSTGSIGTQAITLMNKGLEVIEAHELFGADYDQIEVVVHPQSVVHSMVETTDGATLAQLSLPDMRLPIGYALAYPDRLATPFGAIAVIERTLSDLPVVDPDDVDDVLDIDREARQRARRAVEQRVAVS